MVILRFGKIDYLNLLPFYVFIKSSGLPSGFKASLSRYKGVPSLVNELFLKHMVEAAFISSIKSKNKECLDVGIVARRDVWSVILKKGVSKSDTASATSNMLAKVLGLDGEVFIGDRALKLYLKESGAYIDLAEQWYKKHRVPFVFARLCCNKNREFYAKIASSFVKKRIKIPYYILQENAIKRGISANAIKEYLKKIEYRMDKKSKMGLKKFLNLAKGVI